MPRPAPVIKATLSFSRTEFPPELRFCRYFKAKAVGRCRQGLSAPSKLPRPSAIFGAQGIIDKMAELKRPAPMDSRPTPAPGGIAARAMGARGSAYLADLNPE